MCELSKKHLVRDVIKHVLTLYRRSKLKIFEAPADQPQCFDLRHVDDDSDISSSSGGEDEARIYYKPLMELPPLDLNQQIGEFEAVVLVQKKNWKNLLDYGSKIDLTFPREI
jgi:hypothetical protein